MTDYTPPLRDIRFVLDHLAGLSELAELDEYSHADPGLVRGLLEEAGRFCAEAIAPTNRAGDQQGSVLEDGEVRTPDGFKKVYRQYVDAGWGTIQHPAEFGGGNFPLLVGNAVKEMITSANMAFSLCPLLTTGAVIDLVHHADEELQRTFLPKMVTGEWGGTMNLTEPQAGSDVGALTTRAEPVEDGTYRITGQKIFITYGEHDLTENIIHLVLARLPDAPPGTKGISLFLVPKFLVNDDGGLGERNDVKCVGLEHKLGIHASPTCVMAFGDDDGGAIGYLIGEPNKGMRQMFTMMNDARLGVGIEGLAIAERAYQQAAAYARTRRQGKAVLRAGEEPDGQDQSLIIQHADVRRMLMTMRAYVEAMRCLTYLNARAIDDAGHAPQREDREQAQKLADLLTPISKAWCTDLGVEMTSLAVQVHGGMGYVEETGVAQHFRDARIAPIYEGTNGIQAIDLVMRKLPYDGGAFVKSFVAGIRETATSLEGGVLDDVAGRLHEGVDALEDATQWVFDHRESANDVLGAATPYLRLMGQVVGGWLLARSAAVANELGADAQGDELRFLEDKVATARFYAHNLLPQAVGLVAAVSAGGDQLFAIDAASL